MHIRNCKIEERNGILNLINDVFRIKEGLLPTMEKEYQCLLGESNIENSIVCVDNKEIVGCVNYYQSDIIIEGAKLKVSSIGAVCTNEGYRGRNIVCDILKEGDKQALDKGTCILIISGERKVYLNHGACEATLNSKFIVSENREYDIEIKEYEEKMLDLLIKIYNKEPLRFYRERDEFDRLLKGSMFDWGTNRNKLFIVFENDIPKAYLLIKFTEGAKEASVRELAGDRNAILKAAFKVKEQNNFEELTFSVPINDELVNVMRENNIAEEVENQWGTLKIINLEKLLNDLKIYFMQYINAEELDRLNIEVIDGKYKFIYVEKNYREELIIDNNHDLNKLILGNVDYCLDSIKNDNFKGLLEKMFPIPFVNLFGMNFQ